MIRFYDSMSLLDYIQLNWQQLDRNLLSLIQRDLLKHTERDNEILQMRENQVYDLEWRIEDLETELQQSAVDIQKLCEKIENDEITKEEMVKCLESIKERLRYV